MQTWTDGHQNADLLRANSADFASFTERLLESKPNQDALLPDPAQTAAHAFFAPILASRFYRAITRFSTRREKLFSAVLVDTIALPVTPS